MRRMIIELALTLQLILTAFYPSQYLYSQAMNFSNELEFNEYLVMPETLMYKIQNGETDFVLYDIRDKAKYEEQHIVGALNYPWNSGAFGESWNLFPGDRDIYIISDDGRDGFKALRLLLEKGFSRVYNIEGGMDNWLYFDLLL